MNQKPALDWSLVLLKPRRLLVMLVALPLAAAALPVFAQTIIKNFAGVNLTNVDGLGSGGTPPDTMGASGTNQFVEFINGAFAVYNKAGVRQSMISDSQFWLNAGISAATIAAGLSDTRIIYDADSGRWFASEDTADNTGNKVLLARSDSPNPGGTWKAVSFAAISGGFDFDTLAVDSTGVYIGANVFDSFGFFTGVSFFSIPKSDLIASTPTLARMTRFDNLDDQIYGFTLQGVCNSSTGSGHGVIIAIDSVAFNYFDRTTINNPGAAGATLAATVRISNTYDGGPVPAAQPGRATLDAGDDRFTGMVRQSGGNIFMANTVLQGSRDAVHWLVLNETTTSFSAKGFLATRITIFTIRPSPPTARGNSSWPSTAPAARLPPATLASMARWAALTVPRSRWEHPS